MTVRQVLINVALVVVMAVLVGAIAHLLSSRQPREYQASSQLLFNPRMDVMQALGYPVGPQDHGAAVTDDVLDVRSFDVALRTAARMRHPRLSATAIYGATTVGSAGDVVSVVTKAGSPDLAAKINSAYVKQYLALGRARDARRARRARLALDRDLQGLALPARAGIRGAALTHEIGVLQVFERVGNPPVVIQNTIATSAPVSPQTSRDTLFGLLFGALLGVGLFAARTAMTPGARARWKAAVGA